MSLFGKAHYLQAALTIKGGEKYTADVAKMILASANQTGGKFSFNETWDDSYSRILATPMREQCAVLDAFTAYGETPEGAALVGDVPFKLVRAITQSRGGTRPLGEYAGKHVLYERADRFRPCLRERHTCHDRHRFFGGRTVRPKRPSPISVTRQRYAGTSGTHNGRW